MAGWTELFELVGGRWPMEEQGTAERLQMAIRAAGAAVLFAAVYGLAAAALDMALALGNLWKLPMLVVLSTLCSLPAGLLAWKLSGASDGASKLVVGVAAGNFAATLVLAALSPLVALYYNSSAYWGGPLAMGTVALALVVGLFSAWRLMLRAGSARLPFGVLAVVQMLALLQFTHIASPILPEQTFFDLGVDGLVDPMILALLAAAQAVVVADHSGEPVGDELVWTSIYHLEPGERCIALAVDTPLGAEVCADRDRQPLLVVQSRQPFPDDVIRPPLAVGPVQRVHVKKAVLLPEGLDKGTLSYASPGVGQSLRRQVDRDLMGRRIGVRGGGLYVDPAQVGRGGIPGRVGRKAASEAVTIGVGLVLLGVLALMWAGHRLLDRLARRERNARWLADAAVEEELTWDGIR